MHEAGALTCQQCGAELVFDDVLTAICPFCTCPSFVERPPAPGRPTPLFALTFSGDATAAHRRLQGWLGKRRLFADPALRTARVEDIRGVYLPVYLYSAVARTSYTAVIAEKYEDTRTVRVPDPLGPHIPPRIEEHPVTRTEYRPLAGHHVGYVTDVLVSASKALDDAALARCGRFDLRPLRRFTPALVTGWTHEEFACAPDDCRRRSRAAALERVERELRGFMPGDGVSKLESDTRIEWESLDPMLVPVWVFAVRYREDRAPMRVVINGQTGRIGGTLPVAWWKVALAIVLALAAIAILIGAQR